MNTTYYLPLALLFCVAASTHCMAAQVFIYENQAGGKIVSDYPLSEPGYTLISEKKSLRNLGRIMSPKPLTGNQESKINDAVERICAHHQVDPSLVKAIIKAESSFNANALSKKGAMGLMQLMDDTADQYKVYDSMSPEENIDAGVRHLSWLLKHFHGDIRRALAAYNAGVSAVEKYNGIPPFPETQRYVSKVLAFQRDFLAVNSTTK